MSEAQLDRVVFFQFSPFNGAPANELAGAVPDDIKQDRWDRFMAHQQAISAARLQTRAGRELDVLIDEVNADGAVGRSSADAPQIDGCVYVGSAAPLRPGDLARGGGTPAAAYAPTR